MMSSCWQISFFPRQSTPEFENFLEDYFEVNACNYQDDGNDEYIGYQSGSFSESDMLQNAAERGLKIPP